MSYVLFVQIQNNDYEHFIIDNVYVMYTPYVTHLVLLSNVEWH